MNGNIKIEIQNERNENDNYSEIRPTKKKNKIVLSKHQSPRGRARRVVLRSQH